MQNASEHRFFQKIQAKSEPRGAYSAGAYKKKRVYLMIDECKFFRNQDLSFAENGEKLGDNIFCK